MEVNNDGILLNDSIITNQKEWYSVIEARNNSLLWNYDTVQRNSSSVIRVSGYDQEKFVKNYKTRFGQGLRWDPRLSNYKNTVFIAEIKLYCKQIRIPQNATLILPPPSKMSTIKNIGRIPIGYSQTSPIVHGYDYRKISSSHTENIYELRTEVVVIRYNIEGRLILSPPSYMPEKAMSGPSEYNFMYQYQDINWD